MTQSQENLEEQYARLRGWYLAHLRKGALIEQEKLEFTPAALMKADHEVVMKLAASKADTETKTSKHCGTAALALQFLVIWLIICGSFWIWLLIDCGAQVSEAGRYFTILTVDVWMENPVNSAKLPISPLFLVLPVVFYGLPIMAIIYLLLRTQLLKDQTKSKPRASA